MKSFYKTSVTGVTKRFIVAVAMLFVVILPLSAQVTSYTFSQSAGTYTSITGGTVLGTPTNDDNSFNANPIGFSFCYNGVTYTSVSINANGFLAFGNTVNSSYTALSTGSSNNVVSAFNFDIQGEPTTGELRYETVGSSPNRTFVAQWTNFDAFSSTTNTDTYNFQIRLNETSNTIDIVYGTYVVNAAFRGAQVGLRGNSAVDFNNREISNGLQTWSTSIAGATNTSVCEVNNTPLVPTSGQTFTWTPPTPPVAPINMTFTGVTATGMTINWEDNSTTEANFIVYRSLDNIVFIPVATIPSTSTATTGTPYNYIATGLYSNTLYYWRVEATNAACGGGFLAGQQSTSPGTLCGTYTIGPTGSYPSLTAAVAAVQSNGVLCPLVFEFQAAYVSTVETFPINIPFLGAGPTTSITCRPELGATNIIITSGATQTINFNGTSYFMFDGRPGGVGVNRELSIENTSTTGNAILMTNDVQYCGATYCNIRGVNTSASSGVVVFGNAATGGFGNSNNMFTNDNFTSGATRANNLVYASNATANVLSVNNTFTANNFFNYGSGSVASSAIAVSGGNSAWIISGNNFYQTSTRTFTLAVTHWTININTTTANTGGFVLTGNFIGGSAAACAGTAWTDASTVAQRYIAINVTTSSGPANSIQGNLITNFVFSSSSGATTANGIWCGINTTGTGASMNIGNVTPNTIGSPTANGGIVTTTTTTGGMTIGINNSASGTHTISNNMIGGITANGSTGSISTSIYGIQSSAGIATINSNIIGSATQTNSLMNAASTGATGGHITGILSSAFVTGTMISGNTIANLTNQYAGTSTTGQVRGIIVTSGSNTITGNTIAALSNLSPQIGTNTTSSVVGIGCQSASALGFQTVSGNIISSLANGSLTGNVWVNGIIVTSSTTAGNNYLVFNNSIQAIGAPLTSGASVTNGIQIYGGTGRVYNNMIVLGLDAAGSSVTQNKEYNGINKNTANRSTIAFNSVSVDGAGVAVGTANTYAFRRMLSPAAAPADSVYSNIFSNTRSNGAGTGTHYAIGINNTTNFTSNANDFWGNGTGFQMGFDGTTTHATVAAWSGATTFDANSYGVNPMFAAALNLHINNPSPTALESRAIPMGVNFDFDNQTRPGPVGSVNGGGTIPDIGADEFDGFPVNVDVGIQLLVLPSTTGCHSSADTVRVRLKNYSTVALDMSVNNVTINGSATGPNPATFGPLVISSGTLAGNATMDVDLSTNYNMSASGTYVFNSSTTQASDIIPSNDAMGPVSVTISGGTFTASNGGELCLGSSMVVSVIGYTTGGSVQWESSPDGITWTAVTGANLATDTLTPSDTTLYRAVICGTHFSTVDTLFPEFVVPATTTNDTICGNGTVTLTAAGSGTLNWYDAPTGGNMVFSGTTYTPAISATDTFYVENTSGTPPSIQVTTFAAGNGAQGNMFAITAINTITITGFDGHVTTGTSDWRIDYRPDNYLLVPGANTSSVGWIPLGTATAVPAGGTGNPTPIPISFSVTIPAGQTYSFHVMTTAGTTVQYTNGTAAGNVYVPGSNSDFQFREGHGGSSFNCLNVPRIFNGRIHYSAGCGSTRTMVVGVVDAAPAVNVVSSGNICGTGSSTLIVSSANPAYDYSWTPAASLNQSTGDTVIASPTVGTTYLVTGLDTATGCTDSASVFVGVYMNPTGTATVSNDTVCVGTTVTLDVTLGNPNVVVGTNQVQNTTTTYPAPYGNWYWGARHQFLITAAELTAAGLTAGPIDALSLQVTTLTATALQGFSIQMGHTNATTLTAFLTVPMTTVFSAPTYTPVLGLNQHVFSTMFVWDGVSNIVIETCFNNTSFTNNCAFAQTVTTYNSSIWYRADAAGVCGNSAITGTATQRPRISFRRAFPNNYTWDPMALVSNPNIQNPTSVVPGPTNYIVTITDSTSGCFIMDTVGVTTLATPAPNLGPDTVICSNTVLVLDGTSGPYTYLWQDSTTNQTFNANAFGYYSVATTDTITGCTGSDTVLVGVNSAPVFTLGADVTVCAGTQVSFSGPSGQYSYLWNTGDSVVTITTGTAGSYELSVTDTINGCDAADTVALFVNPAPPVALGGDTNVCSATGSVTLSAPAGNFTYDWSTMDSTQSITVNTTGNYSVLVTDTATGCYMSDTIQIVINMSPAPALGSDTTFCSAEGPITLIGPAGPYTYLWSDASTGMSLQSNATGTYYIDVTDTTSGCMASDTIVITVPMSPGVVLNDTAICGTQVTLNGPAGPFTYLWSDNSTGQSLTATVSGTYSLVATDTTNGCAGTDSAIVNLNTDPIVTASASSMTPCADDANVILTGTPTGGTFTGSSVTGNQFDPSIGAGSYVIVYNYTDVNGCSGSDSVTINVNACVGINEPFMNSGMNVYPNPNNGLFTFTAADQNCERMTIEIVTVEGQVIRSQQFENVQGNVVQEIDMNEFANGTYIMRVVTDGAVYTQRIVKQD